MTEEIPYKNGYIWPEQDEQSNWYCEITNRYGETRYTTESVSWKPEAVRKAKAWIDKHNPEIE